MAYTPRTVTAPYPGHDKSGQHVDPQPMARVRPEAEEFAQKHKGSLNILNPQRENIQQQARPEPRCPTAASKSNYEQHQKGNVGGILGGTATPRLDYNVAARTKPEGQANADLNRGCNTANLFTQYGKMPSSARTAPKVKREGESNFSKDLGGRAKSILHEAKTLPESPRPDARVKPDGEGNAKLDKGGRMLKIINSYGTGTGTDRGMPRVRQEGEDNAFKDTGHRTNQLFTNYGKMPVESNSDPRVKAPGQDNANLDKGSRMNRLIHDGSKARRSPPPPARVQGSAARKTMKNNRGGQIRQLFAANSSKTIVPMAGVRG